MSMEGNKPPAGQGVDGKECLALVVDGGQIQGEKLFDIAFSFVDWSQRPDVGRVGLLITLGALTPVSLPLQVCPLISNTVKRNRKRNDKPSFRIHPKLAACSQHGKDEQATNCRLTQRRRD